MSSPKWLNKKETTRKFSQRRENKLGKKYGAKPTPNSGARWHSKGDLSSSEHLFEVKSTNASQMTIHKEWLEKIRQEAIKTGKEPIMVIDFGTIHLVGKINT